MSNPSVDVKNAPPNSDSQSKGTNENSVSSVSSSLAAMIIQKNVAEGKAINIPSLGIKIKKE